MRTYYSMFATALVSKHSRSCFRAFHGGAPSRNKNADAGGASRLQIFMRLCSGFQRVGTADLDLHNPGRDGAEQRVCAPQQLASVPGMGHEGRTCDVKRVKPVE